MRLAPWPPEALTNVRAMLAFAILVIPGECRAASEPVLEVLDFPSTQAAQRAWTANGGSPPEVMDDPEMVHKDNLVLV